MSDVLRRVVMSLLAAAAIVGIAVAINTGGSKPSSTLPLPDAVEAVTPSPGDLDLRQATIGADLKACYTGVLIIDGNEVPEPDIKRTPALYALELAPQAESDFKELDPGFHRVTIEYWRLTETRREAHSYTWSFRFH